MYQVYFFDDCRHIRSQEINDLAMGFDLGVWNFIIGVYYNGSLVTLRDSFIGLTDLEKMFYGKISTDNYDFLFNNSVLQPSYRLIENGLSRKQIKFYDRYTYNIDGDTFTNLSYKRFANNKGYYFVYQLNDDQLGMSALGVELENIKQRFITAGGSSSDTKFMCGFTEFPIVEKEIEKSITEPLQFNKLKVAGMEGAFYSNRWYYGGIQKTEISTDATFDQSANCYNLDGTEINGNLSAKQYFTKTEIDCSSLAVTRPNSQEIIKNDLESLLFNYNVKKDTCFYFCVYNFGADGLINLADDSSENKSIITLFI